MTVTFICRCWWAWFRRWAGLKSGLERVRLRIAGRILDSRRFFTHDGHFVIIQAQSARPTELALPRELNQTANYWLICRQKLPTISHLISASFGHRVGSASPWELKFTSGANLTFEKCFSQKLEMCIPAFGLIVLAMFDTKKISFRGRLIYFGAASGHLGYSTSNSSQHDRLGEWAPFKAHWRRTRSCYYKRGNSICTGMKPSKLKAKSVPFRQFPIPPTVSLYTCSRQGDYITFLPSQGSQGSLSYRVISGNTGQLATQISGL